MEKPIKKILFNFNILTSFVWYGVSDMRKAYFRRRKTLIQYVDTIMSSHKYFNETIFFAAFKYEIHNLRVQCLNSPTGSMVTLTFHRSEFNKVSTVHWKFAEK